MFRANQLRYLLILLGISMKGFLCTHTDEDIDPEVLKAQIENVQENIQTLKNLFHNYNSFMKRLTTDSLHEYPACPEIPADKEISEAIHFYQPSSCAAVTQSGMQELYIPHSGLRPFFASCLLDPRNNGFTWTVLMRRADGKTSFDRSYEDFKNGFGNVKEDFWIGLKQMHALTYFQRHELWIHIKTARKNGEVHLRYSHFAIDDESADFRLNVLGPQLNRIGHADFFNDLVGNRFSSKQKDYSYKNCVKLCQASWWMNEVRKSDDSCANSRLTGEYNLRAEDGNSPGNYYGSFDAKKHGNINYILMAIRPAKS